jgi:hypothetical protein
MGGIGRIYYTAIDRYAQRAGLVDSDFEFFKMGLRALDEEFIRYVEERRKADQERRKREQNQQLNGHFPGNDPQDHDSRLRAWGR